jgi:nitrogen regulatory protein P-II 1
VAALPRLAPVHSTEPDGQVKFHFLGCTGLRPVARCGEFEEALLRIGRTMKKIEAIIQPFKMDEVKQALAGIGVDGITISEVRGHGRQKGHKEVYRGQEYNVDLLPKLKLEMVVPSDRSEEVVTALSGAARTGKIGDGKIFIYDVAEAVRIRNGDRGDLAL